MERLFLVQKCESRCIEDCMELVLVWYAVLSPRTQHAALFACVKRRCSVSLWQIEKAVHSINAEQ